MDEFYIVVDMHHYPLKTEALNEARVEFVDAEPLCELCGHPLVETGTIYGHPDEPYGCSILCEVCADKIKAPGDGSAAYVVKRRPSVHA